MTRTTLRWACALACAIATPAIAVDTAQAIASPDAFNARAMNLQPGWRLADASPGTGSRVWTFVHEGDGTRPLPTQMLVAVSELASVAPAEGYSNAERQKIVDSAAQSCTRATGFPEMTVVASTPRECRLHDTTGVCTTNAITVGGVAGQMVCFTWLDKRNRLSNGLAAAVGADAQSLVDQALLGAMVGVQTAR